jgi:RNA polymerase sigma factor (sigma-70 family)
MKEYTDQQIIESLKKREGQAVYFLSERYLPMIRLMVYGMGGTSEDAKDLFQEALVIIIHLIDKGDFRLNCKLKTYIYSICEKLWMKILEKRRITENYFVRKIDDSPEHDFSEIHDNKLYENIFYDVFETLEPVCKTILKLYWEEVPPKEIAERLGYTYGYIRKKKCECQGELISKVKNNPKYKQIKATEEKLKSSVYHK